jgi:hypothetical protein
MRLLDVTIVSRSPSLDFWLDPAVDIAVVKSGYTPLSTGLLFGVFICRLMRTCELLQGKLTSKMVEMLQAAFLKESVYGQAFIGRDYRLCTNRLLSLHTL